MKIKSFVGKLSDEKLLKEEYSHSDEFGVLRFGDSHLFFRKGFSIYCIPYSVIQRYFRRVNVVKVGKNSLNVESLVIISEDKEIAEIQLPGIKAVPKIMDILKDRLPGIPSEYVKEDNSVG